MDALNKAEQAKRQGQAADAAADAAAGSGATPAASTTPPASALELTPLTPPASAAIPATTDAPPALPELPSDLEILDQEFIAHAAAAKPSAREKKTPPRPAPVESRPALASAANASTTPQAAMPAASRQVDAQERVAAQNLFTAKQPRPPASKKTFAIAAGLLTLLAVAGIGGYFWLQLQPNNGLRLATATAPTAQMPPAPQANLSAPPASPAPPVLAAAAPAALPAPPPGAPPRANKPAATTQATAVASSPRDEPGPIRIASTKLTLNPSLARGYAAYMAGDYAAAGSEYQHVLDSEAKNIDALHGMAAISLRLGQVDTAQEYYLRAIEANPQDALAQAELIGLRGQPNPLQSETRLKTLLAAQPHLPFLNFALGNLYASQNRWNEAQSAFFKAYQAEPDNPDTLFNLAVSLDQLHQPRLARQYYLLSLGAAANRPASFDQARVNARLRELPP